jgi:hypothetical protein
VIPPPGTAKDGTPCPVTRDFRIVDMDPNDNVVSSYLLLSNGMLAQNTPAIAGNSTGAQTLLNGSDEILVAGILDPLVGCTPFKVPSLTNPTGMSAGLANNELMATKFPPAIVSFVPMNDPMVVVTNANTGAITQSAQKTTLYRLGVGQPPVGNGASGNGTQFCQDFTLGCLYIAQNQNLFAGAGSPMPGVANNLFTFMAQRWANSFAAVPALGCVNLLGGGNLVNPIQLTANGAAVVTAVSINTAACSAIFNGQAVATASVSASATSATAATSMATVSASSVVSKVVSVTSAATATTATATTTTTTRRMRHGGQRHRGAPAGGAKRMRIVRKKS